MCERERERMREREREGEREREKERKREKEKEGEREREEEGEGRENKIDSTWSLLLQCVAVCCSVLRNVNRCWLEENIVLYLKVHISHSQKSVCY